MNALNFETGLIAFSVNGKAEVAFNPTDINFAQKLFEVFDTLDQEQERYKLESANLADPKSVFDLSRQRDREMRELINSIFQDDVCTPIFGDVNVYALADGLPLWCNFLLAVIDEVDAFIVREQKATNHRIVKYTAKYRK